MPSAVADLSGSGPQQVYIWLSYVSYDQGGNYSTWYWELVYKNNGGLQWSSDATHYWELAGFAASGRVYFGIPSGWAGSGDHMMGNGYFTKPHDANGYLIVNDNFYGTIVTAHGNIGSGTAVINSGISAPRIPKKPGPMVSYGIDQITTTGARYRFQAPADNGGSAWTSFAVQRATLPDFSDAVQESSGGTTVWTDLVPGETYYVRSRGQTAAGFVTDWNAPDTFTTLAGVKVNDGDSFEPAGVYVSNGTAWVSDVPRVSTGTTWVVPA